MEERTVTAIFYTISEVCPFNYEAIGLLLSKLQDFVNDGLITKEHPNFGRISDYSMLIQFLKYNFQCSITTI